MNFKIEKSEILFRGKVFDLKVDEIKYESGNKGIREVAVHNGGAVVLPIKEDGKIILVKQYRYPFNKVLLELPAGKIDKGEDPLSAAERELKEETGYTTNTIKKLGAVYSTPGFCTEILHIYLAENLIEGEHEREEGELEMEVHEFTIEEINKMILNGEIVDAKTICGIQYLSLQNSK